MNVTADMINEPGVLDTFFTALGVVMTGLAAGFAVVGIFIYKPVEEEEPTYEEKYREEFEELEEKELSDEEVKSLSEVYLREETPKGDVVMCYNSDTEAYHYWCDDKSIKFLTLDAVAHKYAIENDCKAVCVNYKEEYERAREKVLKHLEDKKNGVKESEDKKDEEKEDEKKSVFAKFKSYNTVNKETTSDDKNKESIQVEKCNKFRYKGKLSDWDSLCQEKDKKKEEKKEVTLTDWLRNNKSDENETENVELKTTEKDETKKEK